MILFLKSISCRSFNHEDKLVQDFKNNKSNNRIGCKELVSRSMSSSSSSCISLTVWKKSLIFSCKGFTVIGSDGNLVYRVDYYSGRRDQTTLMDASGKPILTICRHKQKLRIVDNNWFIYEGEVNGEHDNNTNTKTSSSSSSSRKKPILCVKKQMRILHVYYDHGISEKRYSYIIEGSYANRTCKVLDAKSRNVVAEIRKKQAVTGGVNFGLEVFVLLVMPGFDSGFAMALVLLLDQMFS